MDLTKAQIERLAMLTEESGEVAHMTGKVLRHGFDSTHRDYNNVPNRQLLEQEIGDFLAVVDLLVERDDLAASAIADARRKKRDRLLRYAHHQ